MPNRTLTDNEVLREALIQACRELVYTRKYGFPLPERLTPLTHAEAQEVSRLYDRFFGQATDTLGQA